MLGNLVNRHDLLSMLRAARLRAVLARLAHDRRGRVIEAWADPVPSNSQWWAIPAMQHRWRMKVCGRADVDLPDYIRQRHLRGARDLTGLAPGCGGGDRVLRWAEFGIFRRLDAFDISPQPIETGRREAARRGLDAVVHFSLVDMASVDLPDHSYDVILGEQTLHHFTPLDATLQRLARALKPEGLFYVDEFVGPTRHQWAPRQLAAANALLGLLPARFRRMADGRTKRAVIRPSLLRMLTLDPSEAVESGRIVRLLHEHFEVVEQCGYGGTLLQLVLSGIAHNFLGDDVETKRWLELCFAAEDGLLAAGEVADDFIIAVCRPRPRGSSPGTPRFHR